MSFDDGFPPDLPGGEPPIAEPLPPPGRTLWRTTSTGLILGIGVLVFTAILLGVAYFPDSDNPSAASAQPSPTVSLTPTLSFTPTPSPSLSPSSAPQATTGGPPPPQATTGGPPPPQATTGGPPPPQATTGGPPPQATTGAPPPQATTGGPPPPPANAILNGDFETGSTASWSTIGTVTVHTTAPHSGSYTVQVGSTTATNGDSAIEQTFTTADGATELSFWYQILCNGTVEQDWATVTLKDNVTGGTEIILPKTCTNGEGWKQASINTLTPGRSYTLTLSSRDDNDPSSPTLALYDDIVIN